LLANPDIKLSGFFYTFQIMKNSAAPIGIFDSGIGGLTVARAIKEALPEEQLVYFGDTAHLPYGEKSTAALQAYSVKITDFLISKGCKMIVIACNSASAAAFDLVKEYAGSKADIFNVIDPVVDHIREHYQHTRVGLIGTKQTVNSAVYATKIAKTATDVHLASLATPLLVPMIEEGFYKNHISAEIIASYLSEPEFKDIKALILGCTHYPLIKTQIVEYYKDKIEIIDSAATVAASLRAFLHYHNMQAKTRAGEDSFFVSDYTASFENTTKLFFGEKVKLDKYQLWE
jgi:glutamate racemase